MPDYDIQESWKEIQGMVQARDAARLQAFLDDLSPNEVARALTRLTDDERRDLLLLQDPEDAADLIEELTDAHAADIIEELDAEDAAPIMEEMESDHRADVLGEMPRGDAEAILKEMAPEEAQDARKLLQYDDDMAGGIMVTEFVSYPQDATVAGVIQDLREHHEAYADYGIHYVYVYSERGTLIGVVRMRDLLLAPSGKFLSEIMIANPIYVTVDESLSALDDFFERYPFWNVPVTNNAGKMIGVVRRADLEEAIGEAHEKTLMRFGGIIGGEEIRSMPLKERTSRRMLWLTVNIIPSLMAASVIILFEGTIKGIPALVFFIPVIGNMCGCSGNQAVAVSIRELTLGLIQPHDVRRVWGKEISVGVLNGLVIGSILGVVAFLVSYFVYEPPMPMLGLVVGVAFFLNTLVSVTLGGLIPLALRRMELDPALGAPLLMTTLTDMCGLVLIFLFAQSAMTMGWLG